jgi:HEPN/RES N-terminal domain 1
MDGSPPVPHSFEKGNCWCTICQIDFLEVRVSLTKRLWEEEQERRYHTSEDAVCAECFWDLGFRGFIKDHLQSKTCTLCGKTADDAIAAPVDEVLQFFLDKMWDHYELADGNAPWDNEEGRFFVKTWDLYDLVFDEFSDIADYSTLEWLYEHLKDDGEYCERDWQILSPGDALKSAWGQFCDAIKHETRFLFFVNGKGEDDEEPYRVLPAEMLEALEQVIRECDLIKEIAVTSRTLPVRICVAE